MTKKEQINQILNDSTLDERLQIFNEIGEASREVQVAVEKIMKEFVAKKATSRIVSGCHYSEGVTFYVEQIMRSPKRVRLFTEADFGEVVLQALVLKTTVKNMKRIMKYIDRLSDEWQVRYMRNLLLYDESVSKRKEYISWVNKMAEVLWLV